MRKLVLATLSLIFSSQLIGQLSHDERSKIDLFFSEVSDTHPGVAISIVQNGQTTYNKAFGQATLEHNNPMTVQTSTRMGDLCNQFIGYAVALLAERKKLSLDDDIRKHLPELSSFPHVIRIKHLAHHSHGLPDYQNLIFLSGKRPRANLSTEEVIRLVNSHPHLSDTPGSNFNYCNTGFILLSEIVSRVSAIPFTQFMEEEIFQPLGMNHTFFDSNYDEIIVNSANNYYHDGTKYKRDELPYHNNGNVNMYSSANDLSLWFKKFHENENSGNKAHQLGVEPYKLDNTEDYSVAMGLFVDDIGELPRYHHNALAYGNMGYICHLPDQKFSIAIISNSSTYNTREVAIEIIEQLFAEEMTQMNSSSTPGEGTPDSPNFIKMTNESLSQFCGYYWDEENHNSRLIYLKDDSLRYQRSDGRENIILPIGKSSFRMINVSGEVSLSFKQEGAATLLDFNIGNYYEYHYASYFPYRYESSELSSYAGTYYCKDLGAIYHVELDEDKLIVYQNGGNQIVLTALTKDKFSSSAWYFGTVQFIKGNNHKVTSFITSTSELNGMSFKKIFFE